MVDVARIQLRDITRTVSLLVLVLAKARALYYSREHDVTKSQALYIALEVVAKGDWTEPNEVYDIFRKDFLIDLHDPTNDGRRLCENFIKLGSVRLYDWFRFIVTEENGYNDADIEALQTLSDNPNAEVEIKEGEVFYPAENNLFSNSLNVIPEVICNASEETSCEYYLDKVDTKLGLALALVTRALSEMDKNMDTDNEIKIDETVQRACYQAGTYDSYFYNKVLPEMKDNYGPIELAGLMKYLKDFRQSRYNTGVQNTALYYILKYMCSYDKDNNPDRYVLDLKAIERTLTWKDPYTTLA